MRLTDRITAEGHRLFKLRGVAPLVLLPAMYFALVQMARFELRWGEHVEDAWFLFCMCLSGMGLLMRAVTVGFVPRGTSGRSRGTPSASTLNTSGMYSVVRNPLYLANGIMWLGVALATTSAWFAMLTALVYWLYIERVISAEEAYLVEVFHQDFQQWAARTPCFLPRPSLWRASQLQFSLRTVLRREHSGLIALGVSFTLIEFLSDTWLEGEPVGRWLVTDRQWVIFFAATLFVGLALGFMKQRRWLDAAGR